MVPFGQPASPYIVWRNPAMQQRTRTAKYRDTAPEGRKYYEVLEQDCQGAWFVVAILTVVDGRPKVAA